LRGPEPQEAVVRTCRRQPHREISHESRGSMLRQRGTSVYMRRSRELLRQGVRFALFWALRISTHFHRLLVIAGFLESFNNEQHAILFRFSGRLPPDLRLVPAKLLTEARCLHIVLLAPCHHEGPITRGDLRQMLPGTDPNVDPQ
jgi:hypothetical protein